MTHIPVESSAIKSAAYENGTMEVTFNSGKTHTYSGVSPELFQEFMASDSKGKFFGQKIRGQFAAAQ